VFYIIIIITIRHLPAYLTSERWVGTLNRFLLAMEDDPCNQS